MHRGLDAAQFHANKLLGVFGLRLGEGRAMEGLLSLIQMAKTNASLTHLAKKGLPFISVLTDLTMGGERRLRLFG